MRQITFLLSLLFASLAIPQEAVDWSSLVDKVSPAVITIVSADATDTVQGSGFLINPDEKIVTNFHVAAGKRLLLARRQDSSFLTITKVLATDEVLLERMAGKSSLLTVSLEKAQTPTAILNEAL